MTEAINETTEEQILTETQTDGTTDGDNAPIQEELTLDGQPIPYMPREQAMVTIEAILFAAGHPMLYSRLSEALNMPTKMVKEIVSDMVPRFDSRGIQLLQLGDACQLCTREEHREAIKTALGIRRGGNLSKNSFEVLAIVAYNQPVTRSYVDEVRGVDSSYIMTSLEDKGLIESKGKLDLPGRPTLWGTSAAFLRVFGLQSIKQLPPADVFLRPGGATDEQLMLDIDSAVKADEAEAETES